MRRIPFLLIAPTLLAACFQSINPEELTQTAATPAATANCSACHPFPLQDRNHLEHGVSSPLYINKVNGPVTCLDCHRNSILSVSETVRDSIFRDSNGALWSARAVPVAYGYQEWLTGMAHLNGKVDVE